MYGQCLLLVLLNNLRIKNVYIYYYCISTFTVNYWLYILICKLTIIIRKYDKYIKNKMGLIKNTFKKKSNRKCSIPKLLNWKNFKNRLQNQNRIRTNSKANLKTDT